ncbi:hypothetical protein BX661DRAFT_200456 [Kickxella alabastrina]|uniref:uncharacterized protein n=1 Tax=Kickxella alabastrina TaxID=61397 RepID=UPI00221FA4D2|nr:uncharacterized protein BX661DRAFT_200456 [Kickxella alabastrina]KAI7822274.1 hypothetical protein BX661DRAFT_200456 [Kickxella alabastrina]
MNNANSKLVNKHSHTFVEETKFEMEHLIKRIFGTYPEDYSFGDKGLQYDSVDSLCLNIKVIEILPLTKLLVKSSEEIWKRIKAEMIKAKSISQPRKGSGNAESNSNSNDNSSSNGGNKNSNGVPRGKNHSTLD